MSGLQETRGKHKPFCPLSPCYDSAFLIAWKITVMESDASLELPMVMVTAFTADRKAILNREDAPALFEEAWELCDEWTALAYVILPDHIHVLATPSNQEAPTPKRWAKAWKKEVSKAWPDKSQKPVWKLGSTESFLKTPQDFERKWTVMRQNPVRRGLSATPEDWPYQKQLREAPPSP